MSFVGSEYKKELDRKCAEDINLTAQDILIKAGITDVTPLTFDSDSVIPSSESGNNAAKDAKNGNKRKTKAKTQSITRQIIAIAAALIVVFGVGGVIFAGVRGIGPLAGLFRKTNSQPDEMITPPDSYCLYDVGTTHHINDFDITFEGLTGYTVSPLLQFSIRTDDEKFCRENQTFDLTVYPAVGEENYETSKLHDYVLGDGRAHSKNSDKGSLYKIATATQDTDDPHLYTAWVLSRPDYMIDGKSFVVAVRSIRTGVKTGTNSAGKPERSFTDEIILNAEWRLSFPQYDESILRNTCAVYMENSWPDTDAHIKGGEEYDLKLYYAQFFINKTEVVLEFSIDGDDNTFFAHNDEYFKDINPLAEKSKLIVDGVEYEHNPYTFLAWESPTEKPIMILMFPSVYYEKAESIVYVCGDTSIVIK